jgi:hypothetical protein
MATDKAKVTKKTIPHPPGPEVSWEDQAAYFEKYGLNELEQAGYLEPLDKEDIQLVKKVQEAAGSRIALRKGRSQLNICFQDDQLLQFLAMAKRKHMPPSTLAKSWILERLDQESKSSRA